MKKTGKIFIAVNVLFLCAMNAQELNGIAFYKSIIKSKMDIDSTKMNNPQYMQMTAMLAKPFYDDFELKFTEKESAFNLVPKLKKPDPAQDKGVSISITLMSEDEIIYKNYAKGIVVNNKEVFGKKFLVVDSLKSKDWKLEKESKMIGDYTCFKATYVKEIELHPDMGDFDKTQKKEQTVTAWYTPQIPIKNGPRKYGGLPGLILELKDGELRFLCTKIVINPAEPIEIKVPTKGKKVNGEEFNAIMKKKFKEMTESFRNKKERRN